MKPLIRRILTVAGICSLLISGCSSTEKRPTHALRSLFERTDAMTGIAICAIQTIWR
jgi:uncharacterized protein YcfL